MSYQTLTLGKLKDYVKNNQYDESGLDCVFYTINEDLGVKKYHSKFERDEAYENQSYVYHKCGLAPMVFEKFEVRLDDGMAYCYVTERVKTLCSSCDSSDKKRATYIKWENKIDQLIEELKNIGVPYPDDHAANFGINKFGQLVAIDFGYAID